MPKRDRWSSDDEEDGGNCKTKASIQSNTAQLKSEEVNDNKEDTTTATAASSQSITKYNTPPTKHHFISGALD